MNEDQTNNFHIDDNKIFNTLYKIDVNNVTEKKQNLTYLSWAWAWAEVKKRFPTASYQVERDEITKMPYLYDPKTGYMVFTKVTIGTMTHEMWLPVMDGANKAMKDSPYTYKVKEYKDRKPTGNMVDKEVEGATMFDVNKAIMRCLVKNLAMFGMGLYIYSGEDLPENISTFELASDREVKMFLKIIDAIAEKAEVTQDEALFKLADTAKVTLDKRKWTESDMGLLKRGVTWLKEQYEQKA